MSMQAIIAVRDYAQATGSAYALLLVIADGVDSKTDTMRGRSVEKLARLAHLHRFDATDEQKRNARRRCQRLIAQLIASGELIVETGGYRTKSAYHIPILAGELGYDPQPCGDDTHDCNKFHTPLTIAREDESIAEADKRMSAEKLRRRTPMAVPRDAAPEPPQMRPIDRPKAKKARDAAPEPPQMRPIDHGGAAPEPPQTRPLSRTVSHSIPVINPKDIPDALARGSSSQSQKTDGEPDTDPAMQPEQGDAAPALTPPTPPLPEPGLSSARLWANAITRLRASGSITPAQLASWIMPAHVSRYGWDETRQLCVTLEVPGRAQADMIERKYVYLIRDALGRVVGIPQSRVALDVVSVSRLAQAQ